MHLRPVRFDSPNRYMRLNMLQKIAREWSKVFSRNRRLPYPVDVYGPKIHLEGRLSTGKVDIDGDSGSTDDDCEMSVDDLALGIHDRKSSN